jgi:hypothetical protein
MLRTTIARVILAPTAALVAACAGKPAIAGEWLMGSRDSVDVVMEFRSTGEMRVHQYYFGRDPAVQDSVRHEDSLMQVGGAAANMRWSIHGDSLCMLGARDGDTLHHQCSTYQIRPQGDVSVLQLTGGSPWRRYQGRMP